mmetsp:Transcript_1593/g.3305  ORF Transcript_1593/g.3305 Transcript_1593/m.3305 type:complete len:91 (-) Transcript_1593:413-685(-)
MDAHVYHEGIGKKGANFVASLFMKTLRERGIIKEGRTGGHLVVSFDNCGGQNKNNTMIMILMYLYEMGCHSTKVQKEKLVDSVARAQSRQ